MKKLMMTTVAALGFAALAQADVLNSTGFEDYGDKPFKVDTDDTGSSDGTRYQYWTGTGDFSQTVLKTYTGAEIDPPANVPDAFKGAASNATFLSVDTGNDVMFRKAGADAGSVDLTQLTQGALFFDANVKFTASETNVEVSDGDKLLVWLKGDDTTTNLIVTAGLYNGTSGAYDKTPFIIDGDYSADTWYRLTVKATRVLSGDGENYTTAFNVYIDGKLVTSGGTDLFYSLVQQTDKLATTIAEAGFQGTGALDNVVWTTTDPFPPVVVDTVETTATVTGEDSYLLAFTYAVEDGEATEIEDLKASIVATVGEKITFAATVVEGFKPSVTGYDVTKDEEPKDLDGDTVYVYTFQVTVTQNMIENGLELAINIVADEGGDEPVVPETAETVPGTPVQVKATDSEAAVEAVTVRGVNGTVYEASQKYYTKNAVETETAGVFEVTVTLNETALDADVDAAVEAALEAVKAGATSVALPAGFYYKVESGSKLPIATTATGTTDGSEIAISGLTEAAGFFKVSVGTTEFAE